MAQKISLLGHIEELRKRILYSLVAIAAGSIFSYFFKERILLLFVQHITRAVFLTPQEAFISYLKLSLFSGVLLSTPFIIYQLWAFIWSALKPSEKRSVVIYGTFSLLLFAAGAFFAYLLGLPLAIDFLLGFSSSRLIPMISVSNYINFCTLFILLFGLLFEVPLGIFFATDLGLITPHQLGAKRRYIIVVIFIVAAILSPPDVFTQCILAIPLYLLFEISVLLAGIAYKKKKY